MSMLKLRCLVWVSGLPVYAAGGSTEEVAAGVAMEARLRIFSARALRRSWSAASQNSRVISWAVTLFSKRNTGGRGSADSRASRLVGSTSCCCAGAEDGALLPALRLKLEPLERLPALGLSGYLKLLPRDRLTGLLGPLKLTPLSSSPSCTGDSLPPFKLVPRSNLTRWSLRRGLLGMGAVGWLGGGWGLIGGGDDCAPDLSSTELRLIIAGPPLVPTLRFLCCALLSSSFKCSSCRCSRTGSASPRTNLRASSSVIASVWYTVSGFLLLLSMYSLRLRQTKLSNREFRMALRDSA